jgi:hypothetical protein
MNRRLSLGDLQADSALSPNIGGEDPLHVPGHGHEAPLAADLVEPAPPELAQAENRFEDAEPRLRGVLSPSIELLASGVAKRYAIASSGVGVCGAGGAAAKRSSQDG